MDLNEARKKLEVVLGESLRIQYFAHLRQWFLFNPTLTKDEFDEKVRHLFQNNEQIDCHNNFLLALLNKTVLTNKVNPVRQVNNKGVFEAADYADYVQSKNPSKSIPSNYTYPRAAAELFAPYSGFITCRINIVAWECGMEGADNEVTQLMAQACQTFLKNIITAMISKVKGYKIRDSKFQYGFNIPIPDPYIRNANNVIDENDESNLNLYNDVLLPELLPKCKMSLERTEIDRAYAYAASKKMKTGVTLDTKLLYETIRDNPSLFGQHGIHSVQTLKLSLHEGLDSYLSEEEDSDS